MFENLYDNIGGKVKALAKGTFILEAIGTVITGIFMLFQGDDITFWGIVLILAGPVVAWVTSWLIYAFGDIVENVSDIRNKYVGEDVKKSPVKKKSSPKQSAAKAKSSTDKTEKGECIDAECPECGNTVTVNLSEESIVCPWCNTILDIEFE